MIGLDLGSKFIKACRVSAKPDGKYTIYASMISSEGKNGETGDDSSDLKSKLNLLLRQMKTKNKETTISVGSVDLLARDFSLPQMPSENIEGAVLLEAENSIFESLDDMYSDYEVLSDPGDEKTEVLFIAFPKDNVDRMMDRVGDSDVDVVKVATDNVALANAFMTLEERRAYSQSLVLVNIGHEVSNLAIIDRGRLKFVRNVAFGGADVTRQIAEAYEVDWDSAEAIKRQPEIWDSIGLNIKSILKKSSVNLLEAIFRSMEHAVSRQKIGKIDKIFLTGGGAILKGMDKFIFETLGIDTEKWNPLLSDDIIGTKDREKGFFIPVALGLALQKGEESDV